MKDFRTKEVAKVIVSMIRAKFKIIQYFNVAVIKLNIININGHFQIVTKNDEGGSFRWYHGAVIFDPIPPDPP